MPQEGLIAAYADASDAPSAELEGVIPRQGGAEGGSAIRLTGTGMPNTEVLSCRVGTISGIFARWMSSTSMTCNAPAHIAGKRDEPWEREARRERERE